MINYGPQDKFGYYLVGDKKIHNKIQACKVASDSGQSVSWHWHDTQWRSIDWSSEPDVDIYNLYRMRARQIRERYDYVIINYSGGADSQTLVDAFLDAGCHIDEIVTMWNRKYVRSISRDVRCTDVRNLEAEFDLTTNPGLDRIRQRSPHTKISYRDICDSVLDVFNRADGESWLTLTSEHLNPGYMSRWTATGDRSQLIMLDRGLNTVMVSGIDKPKICIRDDGGYYLYFVDILVNNGRGSVNLPEYDNINYELFYWTPDMPEISIKQAHLVRRWFENNPMLKYLLTWPNTSHANRTTYEKIIKSIIYARYDSNTFQVDKPTSTVTCEWDDWFFREHKNTLAFHTWKQGIDWVEQNIDRRFLTYDFSGKFEGFGGFIQGPFALQ
jgi:hypothetical protein